jgi:hypothetical protein
MNNPLGAPQGVQGYNQSAEFFLSNYRLGKTLGIGSFGKVRFCERSALSRALPLPARRRADRQGCTAARAVPTQVKVAEHVLTGHKVAIKILNRRKIQQMEMEEKGVLLCLLLLLLLFLIYTCSAHAPAAETAGHIMHASGKQPWIRPERAQDTGNRQICTACGEVMWIRVGLGFVPKSGKQSNHRQRKMWS